MSVRLVILGLLRQRPLYGYEIKQIIEEHMGDWTSIAFGSIYFALDKLTEEGFIERAGVEQAGNRPSRSVFQVTETGRQEFLRLLRAGWRTVERQYFDLDLCLFFMGALPREEVKSYLHERIAGIEEVLHHVHAHQEEEMAKEEVPPLARAIFSHTLAHTRAELEWLRSVLQDFEHGAYD